MNCDGDYGNPGIVREADGEKYTCTGCTHCKGNPRHPTLSAQSQKTLQGMRDANPSWKRR